MDHEYSAEQQAYHGGLLDKFIEFASSTDSGCTDALARNRLWVTSMEILLRLCRIMHNILP